MKIYVLYTDNGWDGCSLPEHVTTSLMEAKLWKKKQHNNDFKAFKLEKTKESNHD